MYHAQPHELTSIREENYPNQHYHDEQPQFQGDNWIASDLQIDGVKDDWLPMD